jgi:hypothetical protein
MTLSNTLWVDVIAAPAAENVGWVVKCRPLSDMTKVWVENPPFISLGFRKVLSDEGTGTVQFDLGSKLFNEPLSNGADPRVLLDQENVWEFYQDGTLRYQWLGEDVQESQVSENEGRIVTVSGPGVERTLSWALTLPLGFPNVKVPPRGLTPDQLTNWYMSNPDSYRFLSTPIMSDFITLMEDAHKRGTIPFVDVMFHRATDSAGKKWADTKPPLKKVATKKSETIDGFAPGSSTLTTYIVSQLDYIAKGLTNSSSTALAVYGYGDSSEATSVSTARAQAVADRLSLKLPNANITALGRGYHPEVGDVDPDIASMNRRVVINYTVMELPKYTPYFTPLHGINYFDLLKFITGNDDNEPGTLFLDWIMRPPKAGSTHFRLDVRETIGTHRESMVRFFEGNSIIAKERTKKRDDIRNYGAVRDVTGGISFWASKDSISQWAQREILVTREQVRYPPHRQQAAKSYVSQHSRELLGWTITVAPDVKGRTVFQDYDVGDWIGIESQELRSPTLKMSELYDDFNPPSLDTTKWANTGQAAGEIHINDTGGLRLRGTEATKFARVTTVDDYNFWDSSVAIQVDSMISPGDGIAQFKVARFDGIYFSWWSNGSVIRAYWNQPVEEGGALIKYYEAKWNPTTFKYLRIRHRAATGEAIWESSKDGKTWVVRAKRKISVLQYWLYKVVLETGDNTDPVSDGYFTVRRVNTVSGATGGLGHIDRTPGYGVDVHRVIAINGAVDSDGKFTVELELESSQDIAAKKQARRLAQLDQIMWKNTLPGGVLNVNIEGSYGTITDTHQIVQLGGNAVRRAVGDAAVASGTDIPTGIPSGYRLRRDENLDTWVPVPNVWIQDTEPEAAKVGELWYDTSTGETSMGISE